MIDHARFEEALTRYKNDFATITWKNERYKWEAVEHFQDNWNINADDFANMLDQALAKTYNLLASMNNFPKGMIVELSRIAPEDVRAMFINLFDEKKDYWERISQFKKDSERLLQKWKGNDPSRTNKAHYQNENVITTYLWLRYPDRYYIYKYGEAHKVTQELNSNHSIKQGRYAENTRNHLALYDEINAELRKDEELRKLLDANLTPECYPDPEMRTLTIDFGFYISRHPRDKQKEDGAWWPLKNEYDPGLTTDDWEDLLKNREVFTESSLQIMRRIQDYGGSATCTQLAVKYGGTKNFYNSGSSALARRIAKKTGCELNP